MIGMQYAGNNELGKALEEFKTALICDTNSGKVLHNLGILYTKTGNRELAKTYFQKALLKDPKNEAFAKDWELLNRER